MMISIERLLELFSAGTKKVVAAAHKARVPVHGMVDGKIVQIPECRQPEKHRKDWAEMAFKCSKCSRYVCGWCEGAADDGIEELGTVVGLCDECWFKDHP